MIFNIIVICPCHCLCNFKISIAKRITNLCVDKMWSHAALIKKNVPEWIMIIIYGTQINNNMNHCKKGDKMRPNPIGLFKNKMYYIQIKKAILNRQEPICKLWIGFTRRRQKFQTKYNRYNWWRIIVNSLLPLKLLFNLF